MTTETGPADRDRPTTDCRAILCTANQPGAIALIEFVGSVSTVLQSLTGRADWPIGRLHFASLANVDHGLAGRLNEQTALLMPHGGPRVVQRLMETLITLGCSIADDEGVDPEQLFPEAGDAIEAIMLLALARARSPLAIDLLLDQPRRWRAYGVSGRTDDGQPVLFARSRRLNRLIHPPLVVLAGPANVGKSTLSNALLGGEMSIALDQPGTTRDYTARMIELSGLVVRWVDTPGLRDSNDAIEQRSIEIARRLMNQADLLIAITDHDHDWPKLPRSPDLRIANKSDLGAPADADISLSAVTGHNVPELTMRVRDMLVPATDLDHPDPWLFDERIAGAYQMPIEL